MKGFITAIIIEIALIIGGLLSFFWFTLIALAILGAILLLIILKDAIFSFIGYYYWKLFIKKP